MYIVKTFTRHSSILNQGEKKKIWMENRIIEHGLPDAKISIPFFYENIHLCSFYLESKKERYS